MFLCKNKGLVQTWGEFLIISEWEKSHSQWVTPLGTGHPMMFKKLSGCSGSPRPWAHHDPPWFQPTPGRKQAILVPYCAAELFWRYPLCPNAFHDSQRFQWVCTLIPSIMDWLAFGTFAVLAFAFSTPPPSSPHPLTFNYPANITYCILHRVNTEWVQSNAKFRPHLSDKSFFWKK